MNQGISGANLALEQLRTSWSTGDVKDGVPLVERIWINKDTGQGDLSLTYDTTGTSLLKIEATVTKPPRWLTLNIDLESGSLAGMRVIGFAAKMKDARTQTIRACIRSHRDGGFEDVFFPMYLYATAEETSHLDLLWVVEHEELIKPAGWRTLLLFLEPSEFSLEISELNVFAG